MKELDDVEFDEKEIVDDNDEIDRRLTEKLLYRNI